MLARIPPLFNSSGMISFAYMGDTAKDLAVGAGSTLLAELASYSFRVFLSKDKKTEYKERLTCLIRLARAIIDELPEGQTIKNEHVKAWRADLIKAADEGDAALQSSTSDAKALKKTLTKLEGLTRDAKTYLALLESEKKKEALMAARAAAAAADPFRLEWFGSSKLEPFFSAGAAGNPETPNSASAAGNMHYSYHFEQLSIPELGKKEPLNSATGSPETLIALGCTNYQHLLEGFDFSKLEPLFSAGAAGNPETPLIGGTMYYSHPLEQFGFRKLEKKGPLNSAAAGAAGNPERLIAPGGTIYYAFPKLENKEPLYSAAGAGKPVISLSINPSCRPCVSSDDHHYLNKKRMSSESSSRPTMLEMVNLRASKKRRVLGDSLGEELEKNSSWLYDIDSTGRALTIIGEQSINDHMKMKGKCPEDELDKETGHGKANTPALSSSPSSSYGGANDHIPPSFPDENDA